MLEEASLRTCGKSPSRRTGEHGSLRKTENQVQEHEQDYAYFINLNLLSTFGFELLAFGFRLKFCGTNGGGCHIINYSSDDEGAVFKLYYDGDQV